MPEKGEIIYGAPLGLCLGWTLKFEGAIGCSFDLIVLDCLLVISILVKSIDLPDGETLGDKSMSIQHHSKIECNLKVVMLDTYSMVIIWTSENIIRLFGYTHYPLLIC